MLWKLRYLLITCLIISCQHGNNEYDQILTISLNHHFSFTNKICELTTSDIYFSDTFAYTKNDCFYNYKERLRLINENYANYPIVLRTDSTIFKDLYVNSVQQFIGEDYYLKNILYSDYNYLYKDLFSKFIIQDEITNISQKYCLIRLSELIMSRDNKIAAMVIKYCNSELFNTYYFRNVNNNWILLLVEVSV